MAHKKRKDWKDDFEDTGKTLTEEELENNENNTASVNIKNLANLEEEKPDKALEYLEMAQRIQAEFDNYRRRNLDIASNSRKEGIVQAVEQLLPVLDTINSAKRQLMDENLAKSLDLIYKQTLDCFSKLGVTKIEAIGKPFDPNYHNAIMTEHVDDMEPDIVIDEFQEGFVMDGKVIRHSVVKVSS
jgi:molecular chaperone GrpE